MYTQMVLTQCFNMSISSHNSSHNSSRVYTCLKVSKTCVYVLNSTTTQYKQYNQTVPKVNTQCKQ